MRNNTPFIVTKKTHNDIILPHQVVCDVVSFLDKQKAEDIAVIDLTQKTAFADYLIIASGLSRQHLGALAEKSRDYFLSLGIRPVHVEGLTLCDWVLVDAGDIIIHLFRPDMRVLYGLEKMWAPEFQHSAHTEAK